MKIDFDDKSYLEIVKNSLGEIVVTLSAKDSKLANSSVVSFAKITELQFQEIAEEILSSS